MKKFRVIMLGHTGVGKTTYIASMYGTMQRPIEGFTVSTESRLDHQRLLEMHTGILRGAWPDATDQRSVYHLMLEYEGQPVIPFEWIDYRGGAIRERSSSEDSQQLIEGLVTADCIVVFVDVYAISKGLTYINEIGRINILLTEVVKQTDYVKPLVIAYSKSDMVPRITPQLKKPVAGMIRAIEASDWLTGCFVPLACGRRAMHVETPVLYALSKGIRENKALAEETFRQYAERAEMSLKKAKSMQGWVDKLLSTAVGVPTQMDLALTEQQKAHEKQVAVDKFLAAIDRIDTHLDKISFF